MQCKMPFHVISCHMHNECYMDNTIHTTYRCHGQSHHLHMTSINHFIHVNLSCQHILTFTLNMSFYDQVMAHTSCDTPKPGGPLTTRQPTEDSWMSGNLTPHHRVPFFKTHDLMKIRHSLLCAGSSTQNTTCIKKTWQHGPI